MAALDRRLRRGEGTLNSIDAFAKKVCDVGEGFRLPPSAQARRPSRSRRPKPRRRGLPNRRRGHSGTEMIARRPPIELSPSVMSPPWLLAMSRAIARPRPVLPSS